MFIMLQTKQSVHKAICSIAVLILLKITLHAQEAKIERKAVGGFNLEIYIPSGYDTIKAYKVLYFNDGQTIFGKQGLNVDGSVEKLLKQQLIEPIIIVGIYSDQNRTSNYVPYFDEGARQDFGDYQPSAKAYTQKIINSIIPFIEKNYKTKPGNGIAGYSFGGLHATWAALNYPETFLFSGALSPSYWVNDFEIFKEGNKAKQTQIYYFDVGTGEWNYYVPMLLHSKLPVLKKIFYYEDFGGNHDVSSWKGQRVDNILLLFSGKTDSLKYEWDIQLEIIKSAYTGRFYPRINPVIHYSNGLTCSLSYAAVFILLNPGDGVVNKDGSFRFTGQNDLRVRIYFNGEEKIIMVSYKEVSEIMRK